MKILLIPDKFKGSLSAREVIEAITKGIRMANHNSEITSVLASDGGDGFLNAIAENIEHQRITDGTTDPLGRRIKSEFVLSKDRQKAYIELAKASGLELLSDREFDIMRTSTLGTGSQIRQAIRQGAKEVYIGLGGSATNDAGMGIAYALGYSFFDSDGQSLYPIGKNLIHVNKIESPQNIEQLKSVSFFAVNDVDNTLFGSNGAAYTYAKQKGANAREIEELDQGLRNLSEVVKQQLRKDWAERPGSGAAGGTAYGLKVFLNAKLVSGADFVLGLSNVEELLEKEKFDYIITGEGKFDDQTLHGKLIKSIIDLGQRFNLPVVVVCGQAEIDQKDLRKLGLETILKIADETKSLEHNMMHGALLVEKSVRNFFAKK